MRFGSFNVNSLRSIAKEPAFATDMAGLGMDVFAIEETKMSDDNPLLFPYRPFGFDIYDTVSKVKKGYSGVAVYLKKRYVPQSIHYGLLKNKYDDEGRAVTLEFPSFYFVALYSPNSGQSLERLLFRLKFQEDLEKYLGKLQKSKPVIVTGDLNVAVEDMDIHNPTENHFSAGFTDQERKAMRDLMSKEKLVDAYRKLHPDTIGYTWWSYMHDARANDIGWRIDYFLVSQKLMFKLRACDIHKEIMGSDHCPITLDIDI